MKGKEGKVKKKRKRKSSTFVWKIKFKYLKENELFDKLCLVKEGNESKRYLII